MILYVRQEAYANAVAAGRKKSRAEEIAEAKEQAENGDESLATPRTSRTTQDEDELEKGEAVLVAKPQDIPMPELIPGSEYLVAFLHSAGTATATGMGLVGLSWQEIEAWTVATDNIGIVTPQDKTIISLLSKVYAKESYAATQKGATQPYTPVVEYTEEEEVEEKRTTVADKLGSMLSALKALHKRK